MTPDAELVRRVQGGDVEAFGPLFERYERTLLGVSLARLHDFHAAEEVVQATALRAFQQLHTLRKADYFGSWLMQIARRQAVDALRAHRIPVATGITESEDQTPANPDQFTWIDRNHLLDLVARLPDDQRVLIGKRYFDGHSMVDIATSMGRPVGTITKQLSRAVARLRDWWDREEAQ